MSETLEEQLNAIQQKRQAARRRRYRRSRLERYRSDLLKLIEHGASHQDLVQWLLDYKHVKVHRTTVARMLAKWTQPPDQEQ